MNACRIGAAILCAWIVGCAGPPADGGTAAGRESSARDQPAAQSDPAEQSSASTEVDPSATIASDMASRIEAIHERFVFVDMHAHPSRFHRAIVERIEAEEIARYRRSLMDVAVANVSTDAAYSGGYVRRDGTRVDRGEHPRPEPGEPFAFTQDRLARVYAAIDAGDAVLAASPAAVLEARAQGQVALLPALEGADGLEGEIENLRTLYENGLRLVQLVHFRANELGHIQTYPYSPGGLTEFGAEVVREANRLGVIVDLAHANTQTIMDALEVSDDPIIFSHTGVKALHEGDRYLTDAEIRAIAAEGGVVGIWTNGSGLPRVEDMVRHIDHVRALVGVDHVGIASDLRGVGDYTDGFGEDAEFRAIAAALLGAGYTEGEVGKIMGGNFFRVWQEVVEGAEVVARAR